MFYILKLPKLSKTSVLIEAGFHQSWAANWLNIYLLFVHSLLIIIVIKWCKCIKYCIILVACSNFWSKYHINKQKVYEIEFEKVFFLVKYLIRNFNFPLLGFIIKYTNIIWKHSERFLVQCWRDFDFSSYPGICWFLFLIS